MVSLRLLAIITSVSLASAQPSPKSFPLQSSAGLQLLNVTAVPGVLDGKSGLRVTMSAEASQGFGRMTLEQRGVSSQTGGTVEQLAVVDGLTFGDGTIEVELAGVPDTSVFPDARGFVGIAFRVQLDLKTYDAFYLRPANGRADDQLRRNHSAQYISHPAWPWSRLRAEHPGQYESYVDLVPNTWTNVKIEVRGTQGKLYVHGQSQPTLVINDLKTGPTAKGAVALWIDIGTTAHFRNLTVTPAN
jgi:hypothetical protein